MLYLRSDMASVCQSFPDHHRTPACRAAATSPARLTCPASFHREVAFVVVIVRKPCAAAYSAVRSKRMSKHIVQRCDRNGTLREESGRQQAREHSWPRRCGREEGRKRD